MSSLEGERPGGGSLLFVLSDVKCPGGAADRDSVDLTLSPQIKIVAVAGLVACLAAVLGLRTMGGSPAANATPVPKIYPRHGIAAKTAAAQAAKTVPARHAARAVARAKPAVKAKHVAPVAPVTAASAPAAPATAAPATAPVAPTAAAQTPAIDPRLPAPLRRELERNEIVIVSIYNPQSQVDAIAYAEARAGADLAGAGFLPVNVLDGKISGPLTATLASGLLPDPGVLVYKRPGTLATRFDGFLDRDAVAQAASNAAILTQP